VRRWADAARPLMWHSTRIPCASNNAGMFPSLSAPTKVAFIPSPGSFVALAPAGFLSTISAIPPAPAGL